MTDILVRLENVGRTYVQGRRPLMALQHATCITRSGDRLAVVGPSGSGKSTLLHLMSGIDTPTEGSITWPALGDRESLRPEKVGVVFQSMSLLPALSAVENTELPLLLRGMPPRQARGIARETLEALELDGITDKLPEELSGGQAQRIAIARALSSRPKLLLADEPTGQLDHLTAQRLFDVLLAALGYLDTALIVATHDAAIANRMGGHWRIGHGILEAR